MFHIFPVSSSLCLKFFINISALVMPLEMSMSSTGGIKLLHAVVCALWLLFQPCSGIISHNQLFIELVD